MIIKISLIETAAIMTSLSLTSFHAMIMWGSNRVNYNKVNKTKHDKKHQLEQTKKQCFRVKVKLKHFRFGQTFYINVNFVDSVKKAYT